MNAERIMDKNVRKFIQQIIDEGKDLTLATIRADGYPQATTVSYANDGLSIYVGIGKNSQKAENIRHCDKVSLTITNEYMDWDDIKGVSMGGTAAILTDPEEIAHATDCMIKRYPHVSQWTNTKQAMDIVMLKITPKVISVLDYNQGFGHTELVTV
jgi:nitroimidazol reductase NimA-like FMN-containing flavoprotein (pyridoxamine 5'-phosphate oxidase superfamily)